MTYDQYKLASDPLLDGPPDDDEEPHCDWCGALDVPYVLFKNGELVCSDCLSKGEVP